MSPCGHRGTQRCRSAACIWRTLRASAGPHQHPRPLALVAGHALRQITAGAATAAREERTRRKQRFSTSSTGAVLTGSEHLVNMGGIGFDEAEE
jgi:hypothetical protein